MLYRAMFPKGMIIMIDRYTETEKAEIEAFRASLSGDAGAPPLNPTVIAATVCLLLMIFWSGLFLGTVWFLDLFRGVNLDVAILATLVMTYATAYMFLTSGHWRKIVNSHWLYRQVVGKD